MPIFIERFLLTVFAAVVVAMMFQNPWNLDVPQRVSLALVAVLAAYFCGHTLQKQRDSAAAQATASPPMRIEPTNAPSPNPQSASALPVGTANVPIVPTSDPLDVAARTAVVSPLVKDRAQTSINGQVFQASAGLDQKIYITGSFSAVGGEIHVGIARLSSDGSVDSAFTSEAESGGFAFAFFDDGSFLLSSWRSGVLNFSRRGVLNGSYPSIAGPRTLILNEDGSFFTSAGKYSREGSQLSSFATTFETLAMAKQADGKLLLAGTNGQLIRLNANGSLDLTFTAPVGIRGGNIHGVGAHNDGKIIITGGAFALLPNVFRLRPDGTVDKTFKSAADSYGPVHCLPDGTTLVSSGSNGTSISFDPSGRIVTAGTITRLTADGSLHETQPTPDPYFAEVPGVSVYLPIR